MIEKLDDHRPIKELYSVMVYERHDGSIFAALNWACEDWVDTVGKDASERMHIIANHLKGDAANAILVQACALDETTSNEA